MISVRAVLNLLLVLALAASGLGAVPAEHRMPPPERSAEVPPPCHDEPAADLAAEPSQGRDCCGDDSCACDCLHVSPLLVELPRSASSVPSGMSPLPLRDIASPSPAPRPPLRPPIA